MMSASLAVLAPLLLTAVCQRQRCLVLEYLLGLLPHGDCHEVFLPCTVAELWHVLGTTFSSTKAPYKEVLQRRPRQPTIKFFSVWKL